MTKKATKIIIAALLIILIVIVASICAAFGIDAYVKHVGKQSFLTPEEATGLENTDCIIVLGCSVRIDHTLSDMLSSRLSMAIDLYKKGAAPKLLMSGDHGTKEYDEVNAMKQFAVDCGVPSEDVFMDHPGFSTYETMYRAKDVFKAKKVIIVTQKYHLYRAVYIANKLGLEAYGVASDDYRYAGQSKMDLREFFARFKDFFLTVFKPKPKFLGDDIPISGNGDVTNDS